MTASDAMIKVSHFWNFAIICCALMFFIGSSAVSLHRFWQYDAQYYDFGIFDTALWKVAHFQPPIIDHFSKAGGKLIFADHFSPAIFLLAPLYWLFPWSETILVAQAAIVTLSGLVLVLIVKRVLKSSLASFCVLATYFLYAGLQNALWWDFHEVTIATLPITLLFYFYISKNIRLHIALFIFCLLFKETLFAFGIGWAVFVFFNRKEWRSTAILFGVVSIAWYFATTQILIPYFRGEAYFYQINQTALKSPSDWLAYIFTPFEKLKYAFQSMYSFGLTALFVPELSVVFLLHYLLRFLSDSPQRHTLGLHYNAEIAPVYAFAMILALQRIGVFCKKNCGVKRAHLWIALVIVFNALLLYQFVTKGPFRLSYIPDFYKNTQNFVYLDRLRNQIPINATVAAQSNLASRLTHQEQLWILWEDYQEHQADYIFFDSRDGQNPNNYAGMKNIAQMRERIAVDSNYSLVAKEDQAYLYKRIQVNTE